MFQNLLTKKWKRQSGSEKRCRTLKRSSIWSMNIEQESLPLRLNKASSPTTYCNQKCTSNAVTFLPISPRERETRNHLINISPRQIRHCRFTRLDQRWLLHKVTSSAIFPSKDKLLWQTRRQAAISFPNWDFTQNLLVDADSKNFSPALLVKSCSVIRLELPFGYFTVWKLHR